jgi:O-antigen/teichoic acid export membrane protein
LKNISKVATEYRTFPAVGLPGAVLHIACFQLPAFLLASFYGAGVTGFYLLQDRVLGAPLAVVAQGVASVFYVNAAKLAASNPERLKKEYFLTMRNLSFAALLPTVILVAAGPWLFKVIFGAEWERAGEFARIMAVPMFLRFIGGPLYRCLSILKAQKWILICDGIGCAAMLTFLSYNASTISTGIAGVTGVAVAISLTYAGLIAAASYEVCRNAARPAVATGGTPAPCQISD